jgi:hypothetical protein
MAEAGLVSSPTHGEKLRDVAKEMNVSPKHNFQAALESLAEAIPIIL